MDSYLALKLIHILSATVIAGTGVGIAFFLLMASRSGDPRALLTTSRHVILADWLFTAPAVLIQLITGFFLMAELGYAYASPWFLVVIALFLVVGLFWLPVVKIQYRLHRLAREGVERGVLPGEFRRLMRTWTLLGIPAFSSVLVLFWLMVFKPLPLA